MKRILAERSALGAFGATVVSIGLVVGWSKELRPGWLVAAALAHVLACWLYARSIGRQRSLTSTQFTGALALVLAAIGSATAFSWQFERLGDEWPTLRARQEARVGAALEQRMRDVVAQGRRAAAEAAGLIRLSPEDLPPYHLFRELEGVRSRTGVTAVATFSATGDVNGWAGEHWGRLPTDSLMRPGSGAYVEEGPLYSYLYFREPAATGGNEFAVAAILLETGNIRDAGEGVAQAFAAQSESRVFFRHGGQADADWSLTMNGDTVAEAVLVPRSQAEWRNDLHRRALRLTLLAVLGGFVLLAASWLRWAAPAHSRWAAALPLVLAGLIIAGLPLRSAIGSSRIFEPTLFLLTLPVRGDVNLGRLIALLLPIAALVAGVRRQPQPSRLSLLWGMGGALAVGVAYPHLIELLMNGADPQLRRGTPVYWFGLQLAGTMLLACVTLLALPRVGDAGGRRSTISRPVRRLLLGLGILLTITLGLITSAPPQPGDALRFGLTALWVLPFIPFAVATATLGGRAGGLTRWLVAAWLAGTAVLPQAWAAHVQARLAASEVELSGLGSHKDTDSFLDHLLEQFGDEAVTRFAAGEQGVLLLYRTWVGSQLAKYPYPARLFLWSREGAPVLQLGTAPPFDEPDLLQLTDVVADTREHGAERSRPFTALPSQSRMVTVSLPDSSMITVVVPPRKTLEGTSTIAPFLGVVEAARTRLTLVPRGGPPLLSDSVTWLARSDGLLGDAWVKYPDGWYHAHLLVPVPAVGVRFARATLLLTFDLAVCALLWIVGVVARGGSAVPRGDWTGWLGSFRARVTLALFGFFLIPTAVFGWVAYRALAGEVVRAAETIAQYTAARAVVEFDSTHPPGNLVELAARAGTDVLLYRGGELTGVSSQEAWDLGIYSAWMPPDVYLELVDSRESRERTHTEQLRNRSFITAYAALGVLGTGTLGVPLSLRAGDAAARQLEFAHLVLFAAVVGALLSLALSLAVGRSFAGPIGRLRWASSVVGAGKLHVRLPEARRDEFGQLYAAFNGMVRRLRRARAREIRTARVLAWGEMARQVAHEIKNPLTPIKLSVQHLRRAHMDRHPQFGDILDTNVTQILSEIDRLSDIARAFSRYGAPAEAAGPLSNVDAPLVIREALTLYRSGDSGVRYVDAVDPALPRVRARSDELKEVLLNLVENSRMALDGSGEIAVRGRVVDDRVEIAVVDTGPGIPPELLPRVFDPHFSTRSVGTGLGLAIVKRIVESWGGTVTAESEVGRGTTVSMRLVPATE